MQSPPGYGVCVTCCDLDVTITCIRLREKAKVTVSKQVAWCFTPSPKAQVMQSPPGYGVCVTCCDLDVTIRLREKARKNKQTKIIYIKIIIIIINEREEQRPLAYMYHPKEKKK